MTTDTHTPTDRDTQEDRETDRDTEGDTPLETSDPSDSHLLMADRALRGLRRIGYSLTQRRSATPRDVGEGGTPSSAPRETARGRTSTVDPTITPSVALSNAPGRVRPLQPPSLPSLRVPPTRWRGTETRDLSTGVPGDPPYPRSDQNPRSGGVKGPSRLTPQTTGRVYLDDLVIGLALFYVILGIMILGLLAVIAL